MPKVRVVIPVYNRAGPIADAIESVQRQTVDDWELIVVDDGSTDGAAEVVAGYQAGDARVQLLQQANAGVAAARNRALDHPGTWEYVALLDSDDVWEPNHLKASLDIFARYPRAGVTFARTVTSEIGARLSHDGRQQREGHLEASRRLGQPIADATYLLPAPVALSALLASQICPRTQSVVIRRALLEGLRFDEEQYVLEDALLWCELAYRGADFVYHDQPHVDVRHFGDGLTTNRGLDDPKTLRNQQAVCAYARKKLRLCRAGEDRRVVCREIADAEYLLGQCYGEQCRRLDAIAAYGRSIRYGGGLRPLRSMIGQLLPARLKTALRASLAAEQV